MKPLRGLTLVIDLLLSEIGVFIGDQYLSNDPIDIFYTVIGGQQGDHFTCSGWPAEKNLETPNHHAFKHFIGFRQDVDIFIFIRTQQAKEFRGLVKLNHVEAMIELLLRGQAP